MNWLIVGNGDEAIPMLQYESLSAGLSPRPQPAADGIPGPNATVTSSAASNKQTTTSAGNQLCVQVSTPDDVSVQQYSTGVVSVGVAAAETNTGSLSVE